MQGLILSMTWDSLYINPILFFRVVVVSSIAGTAYESIRVRRVENRSKRIRSLKFTRYAKHEMYGIPSNNDLP